MLEYSIRQGLIVDDGGFFVTKMRDLLISGHVAVKMFEIAVSKSDPLSNKGFALDPVAWLAGRHGTLESPNRSVFATANMRAPCADIWGKTLTRLCLRRF